MVPLADINQNKQKVFHVQAGYQEVRPHSKKERFHSPGDKGETPKPKLGD